MSKNLVTTKAEHHTCRECGFFDEDRMNTVNEGYRRDFELVAKQAKQVTAHQGKLAIARLQNQRAVARINELEEQLESIASKAEKELEKLVNKFVSDVEDIEEFLFDHAPATHRKLTAYLEARRRALAEEGETPDDEYEDEAGGVCGVG